MGSRWSVTCAGGVYVVFKAESDYAASCFRTGPPTDTTGRYAAMYKPYHLIGLELSISVLNVALRGEPTGTCREWRGDAVAVAEARLEGRRNARRRGRLHRLCQARFAARSRKRRGLPIGLANQVKLVRDVAAGDFVTVADVALAENLQAVERACGPCPGYGASRGWPWHPDDFSHRNDNP